jgi:hypothetical protein
VIERDEIFALAIFWFFASIIGYAVTSALWGILLACLIVTYPALFIIRYFKYSKKFGVYKLPPFACEIYDESGLLASFKAKDWVLDELPKDMVTEKELRIKKYNVDTGEFEPKNNVVALDFLAEYSKLVNEFLKQLIPNPSPNPEMSLDTLVKKIDKPELVEQYNKLTKEQKIDVAELARLLLAIKFGLTNPPKVYQIASLTQGVYIYWFAFAPPIEYATKRTKMKFRAWNVFYWVSGFPVVEMWGKEVTYGNKDLYHYIGKRELKVLMCMPLQDEMYRQEKFLNIKKYSLIASALGLYTEKVLEALPSLSYLHIVQAERDRYKELADIYKDGLDKATADLSSVSSDMMSAYALVSKAAGVVSRIPGVPKALEEELKSLVPSIAEKKSKIDTLKEKLSSLVYGPEAKPKPPTTVPTTEEEKREKEKSE